VIEAVVSKLVRVEKDEGFKGGIDVVATPKLVKVKIRVTAIPEGGGTVTLFMPWGKIFGIAKKANPAKAKS